MRTAQPEHSPYCDKNRTMNYLISIRIAVLLCGLASISHAQIVPFTQFYNAPSLLNSSLTGLSASTSIQLINRNHWIAADNAYTTSGAVAEFNVQNRQHSAGVGFFILNDAFGEALFESSTIGRTSVGLSASHHAAIGGENKPSKYISGGMSLRLVQTSVNWDDFIFSDQIHAIFGATKAMDTRTFPPEASYTNPAIHAGANYIHKGLLTPIWNKLADDDYFEIGLSFGSLITVRNSIYNYEIFERKRLTTHFRYELVSNSRFESNNRVGVTGRFDRIYGNGSELALNSYLIRRSILVGTGYQATLTSHTLGENIHRMNVTAGYVLGNDENNATNKICMTYNYSGAINGISNSRLGYNHEISIIMLLSEKGFKKTQGVRQDGFF